MEKQILLNKTNFARSPYTQTIDTTFSQLVPTPPVTVEDNLPTVDEFFTYYDALFFQIPQTGENSHTSLIETSVEYIGYVPQSLEIEALQQEITFLREQLLETRQQIESLSNSNTKQALDAINDIDSDTIINGN